MQFYESQQYSYTKLRSLQMLSKLFGIIANLLIQSNLSLIIIYSDYVFENALV